ncbi:hypothetical protein TcasGA2_TC004279 [Tribolium castaneum]|uniref:Uncharacterized protein n=1 Tax=Tribolium castaneum TaxID=7070 RepID=D7EK36_TRICA|nr:hypothetical protein TcasGA2_TC004279 [Tribolium castaneum]
MSNWHEDGWGRDSEEPGLGYGHFGGGLVWVATVEVCGVACAPAVAVTDVGAMVRGGFVGIPHSTNLFQEYPEDVISGLTVLPWKDPSFPWKVPGN